MSVVPQKCQSSYFNYHTPYAHTISRMKDLLFVPNRTVYFGLVFCTWEYMYPCVNKFAVRRGKHCNNVIYKAAH
jgi:hypothetical protein